MLTGRQTKILHGICEAIKREGFAPSLQEIGEAVGLTITPTRNELLELERQGFIKRRAASPRSIKVLRWPMT